MPSRFDEKAKTWDDEPHRVQRAREAAAAIREAVALSPSTRMLEYGAGTGLVAQHLAADVGPITLAEPSAGMREVITDKIERGALPTDARLWDLDLATAPAPDERFDVIVTVMTLHHIPDLSPVLAGFQSLLGDGGDLCVVDLEGEDGSFHDNDPDFEGHDGFTRDSLTGLLEAAGFTDVRFEGLLELEKGGRTYPVFLAVSRCARAT